MIGVLLLLIALLLYYSHKRAESLLLFFVLLFKGMYLIPLASDGIKTIDLSLIYIFVILLSHLLLGDITFFKGDKIVRLINYLLLFFLCSIFFSFSYYNIPIGKTLIVVRGYMYILAYFIIRGLSYKECQRLLTLLAVLTFVSCFLYCAQLPLGRPLLVLNHEMNTDTSKFGGLMRYTNFPPLRNMFIYLSFFAVGYYSKFVTFMWQRAIFLLALILPFGRGALFSVVVPLLLGVFSNNKKMIITIIVFSILAFPLLSIVLESFSEGRNTMDDLQLIADGGYVDYTTGYKADSTSFTYRIAWLYERLRYIMNKPIIEWFFGLGLISEQDPLASQMYRFYVVDYGNQSENFQLLYSADIGYGNFITRFGILGTIAMMAIWIYLFKLFYRHKSNVLMMSALLLLIENFLETFASRGVSETSAMVPFFLLLVYYNKQQALNRKMV